jgi:hypothetical protein
MKRTPSFGLALLTLSASVFGGPVAHAADGPERPVRVLLFADGPSREYRFLRDLFAAETERKHAELSVCLQQQLGGPPSIPGVPAERVLKQFPSTYRVDEKATDLQRYDVIIAIDPDWTKLSEEQLGLLAKWADRCGGLIVVGGPINTIQLARPGRTEEKLKPVRELLPVVLKDVRIEVLDRTTEAPWPLEFPGATPEMEFLKLTGDPKAKFMEDWKEFFFGQDKPGNAKRGFYTYYPAQKVKQGAVVVATFQDPRAKLLDGEQMPYIVLTPPGTGRRVVWLAGGETWRLAQYRADFYARFWAGLVCHAASCEPWNVKPAEPRVDLTTEERRAVEKGLGWLTRSQARDGHWEGKFENSAAVTGLAGVALLMDGNTLTAGRGADAVRRAADYLILHAQPSGLIGDVSVESQREQYLIGHALALRFLAHCYGEEEEPGRRKKLGEVLVKAVEFTRLAQCKSGGWGGVAAGDREGKGVVDLRGGREGHADVFATLAQLDALRAAREAGVAVPADVLDRARVYLEKEVDPASPAGAAAAAVVFGAGPYEGPLAQKWLKIAPAPAVLGEGNPLRDEYLNFGHARLVYALGDSGYAKVFPKSKAAERWTWGAYRKAASAALLKAQAEDGRWGGSANTVHATALYLAILELPENALTVPLR